MDESLFSFNMMNWHLLLCLVVYWCSFEWTCDCSKRWTYKIQNNKIVFAIVNKLSFFRFMIIMIPWNLEYIIEVPIQLNNSFLCLRRAKLLSLYSIYRHACIHRNYSLDFRRVLGIHTHAQCCTHTLVFPSTATHTVVVVVRQSKRQKCQNYIQ